MKPTRELTRAELDIMQVIWSIGNGFLSDIINQIPEPRPAYTTVSTVIRVLVRKGFVGYKVYGKQNSYYPLITKEEYTFDLMDRVKVNFFEGSIPSMISFFAKKEKLTNEQRAELMELLENEK